ncbi:hypothetical protein JCM10450v2_006010 [Rhodotorula kratochvilovae]
MKGLLALYLVASAISWTTLSLDIASLVQGPQCYAQQLSLVFALANLIALTLTLLGTAAAGRGFRTEKLRSGWKLVAGLMTLQALCMCLSSSLVAYEFHHDARFANGSKFGRAWVETVVAYALNLFIIIVLLLTRVTGKLRMVPGDDGYEPIDDRRDVVA